MIVYRLRISPRTTNVLQRLPPELKHSIKHAIRALRHDPHIGEPLRWDLVGFWKYRVRTYRIVYSMDAGRKGLRILAVGDRRDIYERAAAIIKQEGNEAAAPRRTSAGPGEPKNAPT